MEKKGKILFIDRIHPAMQLQLEEVGFECDNTAFSYEFLLEKAHEYTGYIIRNKFVIDRILIDASTQLKFIARIGSGMENIDTQYAAEKNIACINSPEGNADAVAEYVIGSLLCLFRNTKRADSEVREGIWQRNENRGLEICNKTIGIIGYGHMGKALAKKLSSFDCKILAYDKYKTDYEDQFIRAVDLPFLQQEADIVSVHINYLPENHYFINNEFISNFAKNIYLVNTSRGKVLSTEDLVSNLSNGKIKGAILDVLEYENVHLQNKPIEKWDRYMYYLSDCEDVILSPHIAGQTFESISKHCDVIVSKIKKLGTEAFNPAPFMKKHKLNHSAAGYLVRS
jgi:D-3-phosphoglycerate dehydrogenase